MTSQEEFEAWAAPEGFSLDRNLTRYVSPSTNATWNGWQAATVRREAMFDILMRRNIEVSDEAYLSLRVVGVPPSKDEFVSNLRKAIAAALATKESGNDPR